jgi:predicted enzyme related to lactoylglutathione lyase
VNNRFLVAALIALAGCASHSCPTPAAPSPPSAPTNTGLEYVGGTAIQATDPKALSAWYGGVFGMTMMAEMEGMGGAQFGGFEWNGTAFNIAIVPVGSKHPGAAAGSAYLVFHVTDYDAFVAARAAKGATPFETSKDEMGRFATFRDPEGNQVGVWGK